ncbi:cellulase family glycosylhydrolase [Prescottella equi]|uniref:cellulase family glycosylhydrolase n=1 Tax=Rhodococcus hoagii TaxID=43767 RepID=UPI000A10599D|nr:cellulase family glycosylhydrolase [Prescottella equi]MBM4728873.1 cellulase family glycosylhydrolase [Prescottella equi]NKR43089.1 cellulase family glycosylhydrolase [Prescottella equi]NKR71340.1 cellulase family glycosylhydrolase [Prescottella equi]NKS17200.1 cellulase family glycosylhydrolase [Prescottella equi]NKS21995.1 cellulase family glycosylhydrolase [Prescottella equi]
MGRVRVLSLAAVGALVLAGGIGAALRADPAPSTAYLTDDAGRALILNGFNTASSAKSTPDGMPTLTEADLDREHTDMGTNFVRFLISWRSVEPEPGVYSQEYLDRVAERVDWYAERGYSVMLDMHQDLYSSAITPSGQNGNGAPAWATYLDGLPVGDNDMWEMYYLEPGVIRAFDNFWNTTGKHPELTDHYANAWRAVAERFAGNPAVVAYDLMNEPYGGTLQGAVFEAGPLTALYQKTSDAIRTVDRDTWVCVAPQAMGTNWGTPSGLRPIDDARDGEQHVAYCPHIYPLPMDLGGGYTGSSRTQVDATIDAWRGNVLRTAAELGNVPIILGEFGLDTTLPGALDYVNRIYDTAREMGAGVSYWSRDPGPWGPYEEDGTERNLVATLDEPYPRAIAGQPVRWSADADRLEFSYVPNLSITAPTEVYLPVRTFPDGPDVDGAHVANWNPETRILTLRAPATRQEVTVTVTPRG